MRLSERRKVDLPQPDGPISAVTLLRLDRHADVLDGLEVAVVEVEFCATSMASALSAAVALSLRPELGLQWRGLPDAPSGSVGASSSSAPHAADLGAEAR